MFAGFEGVLMGLIVSLQLFMLAKLFDVSNKIAKLQGSHEQSEDDDHGD